MEKHKGYEYQWLNCDCNYVGHHIRVAIFYDEDSIYLEYHLCKTEFWHRLWNGIKYIFGSEPDYHDIILNPNEQKKLKTIIENKLIAQKNIEDLHMPDEFDPDYPYQE